MLVPCSCNYTAEPQIRQGFRASGSLNRVEDLVYGLALRKPPENIGHKVPRGYRGCGGHEEKSRFVYVPV